MTITDPTNYEGSGWYDDDRTLQDYNNNNSNGNSFGKAWKYGLEQWCNLEGRYMHIVADLSHLL